MAIRICSECGEEFDLGNVRRAINRHYRDKGFYENCIEDEDLCYWCARRVLDEGLSAGLDLDFEIRTGRDRSERPEDWDF